MASVPHPIPYQGSKRRLAPIILDYFPAEIDVLYEPFAGSAAVSLAAASARLARRYVLGDSLTQLAELWNLIIASPEQLADDYAAVWAGQHDDPRGFYDQIRDAYNREGGPARLLFLLARCVKNAVRFNANGEFNQSPDKRRLGTQPERMRKNILGASALLRGHARAQAADYAALLAKATPADLVYLDPPYQGTSGDRDQRYHQPLDRDRFIRELDGLLTREIPFIISFDGRSGTRTYGPDLPESLGLTRLEIHAGRSSQATLNGSTDETYESLYLSPGLAKNTVTLERSIRESQQRPLPGV